MSRGRILSVLGIFVVGGLAGLVVAGVTASFVGYTNKLEFCISCHEMESTVYQEYKKTAHFQNQFGVRAVCANCHVPHHSWIAMMLRKMRATVDEIPNHFMGTLDTPEKFEAHRLKLAKRVWAHYESDDSRECRSCHVREAMLLKEQRTSARTAHEGAVKDGKTCIDCHKGITHKLPEGMKKEEAPKDFTF